MSSVSCRALLIGCTALVVFVVAGCTSTDPSGQDRTSAISTVSASVVQPSQSAQTATSARPSSASDEGTASASVADPTTRSNSTTDARAGTGSESTDASSQEAADRRAVEEQWVKFWAVYGGIGRTPVDKRAYLVKQIAIEPTSSNVLKNAASMDLKGLDTYGKVIHHISWQARIDGGTSAVIADCQDQSKYGSVESGTGIKKTVGVSKDNMRGEFLKGNDNIWRLRQIYFLTDIPC